MDCNTINSESDINTLHKLNSTWSIWYHNPIDKNWSLGSYIKMLEIDTIEDFWKLFNSWEDCLPPISEGMFFLMRKLENGTYINPLWEDKNNRSGGFWSFKINKEDANLIWKELSINLISETISKNVQNTMMINGISISPKRNFCIIKIWNNNTSLCDKVLLNNKISNINFSECMYKCHVDNIANDKAKIKKSSSSNHKKKFNSNNNLFRK